MKELIPIRRRHGSAIILALLTMVALLAAPMCAPLCAAKTCSSNQSDKQCHELATMGAGGEQFLASGKTCMTAEFSAVLSKSDEQLESSRVLRSDSSLSLIGESYEMHLETFRSTFWLSSVHRIPPGLANDFLLSTILRV